jgi:hypothetical protein
MSMQLAANLSLMSSPLKSRPAAWSETLVHWLGPFASEQIVGELREMDATVINDHIGPRH